MPILDRFSPPGNLEELTEEGRSGWNHVVRRLFERAERTVDFPQFVDPTKTDMPAGPGAVAQWPAFPATQRKGTDQQRWERVDNDRGLQDEYCEWNVQRDAAGDVLRVTFTTEMPEYYDHLLTVDEDRALDLFEAFTGSRPSVSDLRAGQKYIPANPPNSAQDGSIVHLSQGSNNLFAAIALAAQATILRHDANGDPVTDQEQLVECGGLGEKTRSSDPQIAAKVNALAAEGHEITLADPVGLYLTGIMTNGMKTPDGADPATFWTPERGDEQHLLRARFAVPDDKPYTLAQVTINGQPIRFGAQLADRVGVRIEAIAKPANHQPQSQPCVPPRTP